jgi:hypothetical protein
MNQYINQRYYIRQADIKDIYQMLKEGKSVFYDCNDRYISPRPIRNSETAFYVSPKIENMTEEQAFKEIAKHVNTKIDETIQQQRCLIEKYRSMNI